MLKARQSERDKEAGLVLAAARKAAGLTQPELGIRSRYSDRQIARFEAGESPISYKVRLALESVLGPLRLPGDSEEGQEPDKGSEATA